MESKGGEAHRNNKPPLAAMERPDSRFYSGRNPVPRMQESLWELVPDIVSSSESEQEDLDQRKKKRLAKTKEVLDPITGRMWVYIASSPLLASVNMDPSVEVCDAKYAPPPEPTKKPPVLDPPESWRLFMEEVRVHSASPLGKTYLS